ncbi:sugar porter family MFS transporter [Phaeacidiphilus oryzae]|uniref:sugar porter family MFS transporter n=1 Tax=Phaeacidiphilus oryzae TaxID=348818 RepID=UPI000564B4A6|nr:sugar porter family MFS transporter [Phaeacidiphilus oryzae]
MADTTTTTGVLSELDRRVPTRFYWSLTLLATLGGFLFGYDTSNIGSALNFVPYPMGGFALGYLVSGASLGAAVGALAAGPLTDRFGRKSLLVADALIYALGAILSALTPNAEVLLVARTLIGLAIGADSAVATAYIAEYAPSGRRGALSILQQWMITVGILVAYLVALVIFKTLPRSAGSLDWRLILGLGAVPALLGLVLRARMPESPRWLLRRHRYEDARRTLGRLGVEAGLDEVERTAHQLEETDRRYERDRRRGWSPGVRRALVVVCVFFVFQQITGINVPLYYGPHLLGPIFQENGSKLAQTTSGIEVTAIMTAVNVAATYLAFRWIDRIGRRKLAIGGYLGMGVMALVAAAGLGFLSGTAKVVVVMAGLSLFIAAFAIGVGGTGWLLQGEVFPTAVRGQAASIGAAVDWVANFALIEVIPIWQSGVGLGWVMVSFAALCVLAVVFVHRLLPETRGRSVEEITAVFERQAAA